MVQLVGKFVGCSGGGERGHLLVVFALVWGAKLPAPSGGTAICRPNRILAPHRLWVRKFDPAANQGLLSGVDLMRRARSCARTSRPSNSRSRSPDSPTWRSPNTWASGGTDPTREEIPELVRRIVLDGRPHARARRRASDPLSVAAKATSVARCVGGGANPPHLATEGGPGFSLGRDEAELRPVGVDLGRAWLTLEHVRPTGPRADDEAAVTASACPGAPRRWCSCASLRGSF
jgi:hypothetical protein